MGFTKLDENIIESSIMAEDDSVFKIWIFLLAKCREDGVARVSPAFIASVTRKSNEDIAKALQILSSPDPLSRSTANDGRRIERVDGGFLIVNYRKYREFLYSDTKEAIKKRNQRGHQGTCPQMSPNDGDISASASASLKYINSNQEGDCKGETNFFTGKTFDEQNRKKEEDVCVAWRTDFSVYETDCVSAFKAAFADKEWMDTREKYHPTLDIKLSLEKALNDFWATEAGWVHKKKKKNKTIDWRRTIENALSLSSNQVRKCYEKKSFSR